jgi:hypothetical protein
MRPLDAVVTAFRQLLQANPVEAIRRAVRDGHVIYVRLRRRMRAADGNIRLSYVYCPDCVWESNDAEVVGRWLRGEYLPAE